MPPLTTSDKAFIVSKYYVEIKRKFKCDRKPKCVASHRIDVAQASDLSLHEGDRTRKILIDYTIVHHNDTIYAELNY